MGQLVKRQRSKRVIQAETSKDEMIEIIPEIKQEIEDLLAHPSNLKLT
jgi:hypothetical protein